MRDGFLLDPDVVYLNHGGYGACPVAVFGEYQRWQRELERQPTDFFASDVYLRAIIDLAIVRGTHAAVFDYKTGKIKDDFTQLTMSAAVLSRYMPELETFDLAFVWLKHKNISRRSCVKRDFREVWSDLIPRANKVEEALKTTNFPAKKSGLCRGYCPVKSCPNWEARD